MLQIPAAATPAHKLLWLIYGAAIKQSSVLNETVHHSSCDGSILHQSNASEIKFIQFTSRNQCRYKAAPSDRKM